jgi:hypothetical protein
MLHILYALNGNLQYFLIVPLSMGHMKRLGQDSIALNAVGLQLIAH